MNEYIIRKATKEDIPFLANIVIKAEKGMSDKLSYSTLFNLSERKVKNLIIAMFEEEIDGCELSLTSFLVTEYKGKPVAALGAWIEAFDGCQPSKILKSNLISYTFGIESIEFLKTKSHIIKDILVEREPMTLQLEYLHVSDKHIGKKLDEALLKKLEENGLTLYPPLEKAQAQLFRNTVFSIKLLIRNGYKIVKSYKSGNNEIFNYLPFNEKILMEKKLK